jgi:hypothetical protein
MQALAPTFLIDLYMKYPANLFYVNSNAASVAVPHSSETSDLLAIIVAWTISNLIIRYRLETRGKAT